MQSLLSSLNALRPATNERYMVERTLTACVCTLTIRFAHRSQCRQALSTGSSSDASMQSLLSSLDTLRPGALFMSDTSSSTHSQLSCAL